MTRRILVTGAGGFIGHHLVKYLASEGHWVRGVDIKYPEYEASSAHEFELLNLRWEPQISLREGLVPTYHWIESELQEAGRVPELA